MNRFKKLKIKENNFSLYSFLLSGCLLLFFVGEQGEPYALPLFYAMLTNGLNLPLSCLFFLLSGILNFQADKLITYACQAVFLFAAFLLFRRLNGKNKFLPAVFLAVSASFFVFLFPLKEYAFFVGLPLLWQKIILAVLFFLLGLFFQSALRLILFKLTRCRLSREELLHIMLLLCVIAIGLYKCCGTEIYFALMLFAILLYLAVVKNASTLIFALLCAIPPALTGATLTPIALYALYASIALFFLPLGRFVCVVAVGLAYAVTGFLEGVYQKEITDIVFFILVYALPCLFFLLLPAKLLKRLEKKLIFYRENHLVRIAINRNRSAVGEKLFSLSGVFRRIENTFNLLAEENRNGEDVKGHICEQIERKLCVDCAQREKCRALNVRTAFYKLIAVGEAKGKVSLIDLPSLLSANCVNVGGVLFCLNQLLGEYRKYTLEAENAKSGRQLIAAQAQGISELLKTFALQQSQTLNVYDEKEKRLFAALAKRGIICSEILIYGEEEDVCITLTVFGKCENAKIVQAASEVVGMPLLTGEKLVLSSDKFCYILRKKPHYDAAFGVSTLQKKGETFNGDTHSVIRIDEKHFLTALSDGMGSGQSAWRISESALSLLESFYRAGMPGDIILSTVNKLLSFNREESFACIDLASVNLETGRADIVKIGSPLGFIFSAGTIRVLEGESLPMGSLEELHPTTLSVQLQENDILLFLSDGITDAFGSSSDLFDYLKTLNPLNPQALTDDVLHTAISRTEGVAKDDMTALAVRIFKAE